MLTKLNHKYRCTVGAVDIKKIYPKKNREEKKKSREHDSCANRCKISIDFYSDQNITGVCNR